MTVEAEAEPASGDVDDGGRGPAGSPPVTPDSGGADSRPDPEDAPRVDPQGNEESAALRTPAGNMLRVVEGRDLSRALAAQSAVQQCQYTPIFERDWERREQAVENIRNDPEYGPEFAEHHDRALEAERQKSRECLALLDLRTGDYFDTLRRRAEAGDPFARFGYSIWPPRDPDTLALALEPLMDWETTALEFTLQNLDEGHPLGLLGLGMSYLYGSLFTPARRDLAVALIVAADLCSGEAFDLRSAVEGHLRHLDPGHSRDTSPGPTLEEVLQTAARLHETYCAASVSNTLD